MLCKNLKRIRKERKLSQKDVAEYLNITAQSISKWEKGDALPSVEFLPRLSALFGCSIDDFFTEEKMIIASEAQAVKKYLSAERDLIHNKIDENQWRAALETIPYYYEHTLKFFIWLEKRKTVTGEQLLTYFRCSNDDVEQIIESLAACEIIVPLDVDGINNDELFLVYSVEGSRVLLTMHHELVELNQSLSAKELAEKIKSQI